RGHAMAAGIRSSRFGLLQRPRATIVARLGMAWLERKHSPVAGLGLLVLVPDLQKTAEIVESRRIVGLERQSSAEGCFGFGRSPHIQECIAQVIMKLGNAAVQCDCLGDEIDG